MTSPNQLLILINGNAKNFLDEVDKIKKSQKDIDKVLSETAKTSAVTFAAITAAMVAVTKAFADYETALVGVGKTTNIEGKKLQDFGKAIQDMSKRIPIAANELLGIAQAAGQLGVSGEENLLKFTDTIAKLGVATDLSGEEAATALTRILTVTNESISTIDKFGSVIVALGNNFAATESEITRMTTEVSRATSIFKVSATDAAALGTSMKAIGIRAELGGSVVGRAFREIQKSIDGGGDRLKALERLTGLTGEQLKKTFAEDATGVFKLFLQGLKDVGDGAAGPGGVVKALEQFELKGDEILKVLPALANNTDLVTRALSTARNEYQNATALNNEAAKAFDTLNSRAQVLKNSVTALAVDFGSRLAPSAKSLVESLIDLTKRVEGMDESTKNGIATLAKIALVVSGAVAALSTLGLGILGVVSGFAGLKLAVAGIATALAGISLPVVAVGAAAAAAGVGIYKLLSADSGTTAENLDEVNQKIAATREQLTKQLALQKELGKQDDVESKAAIARLEEKLGLLEQQKKQLEENAKAARLADQSFGTGQLLQQDVQTNFQPLGAPKLPGDVELPVKASIDEANSKKQIEELKKTEDQKGFIVEEGVRRRVEAQKIEQERVADNSFKASLQQVNNLTEKERQLVETELDFAERKRQLRLERLQAEQIEQTQERDAALATVQAKNEALLLEEQNFLIEKERVEAEERERKAALNEELRELELEDRARLRQEDLDLLNGQLQTEDEAKRAYAVAEAQRNIQARNKELADRQKYGQAIATLNKFFNSEEVQGIKRTTSDLEELRNSSSKKQQAIGKAAARVNAAIKTAEGAIAAYTSLAPIPIVGPALGAAAAAALVAYGLEQQRKIDSVQVAAGGGIVPNSVGGSRDRTPILAQPGELIVPEQLRPTFLEAVGRPEVSSGQGQSGAVVQLELKSDLIKFVEDGLQERKALGITSSGAIV